MRLRGAGRAWLALAIVGALAAVAVALALGAAIELRAPHAGWEGEAVTLDLPRGLDARAMLDRLGRAGVLRSPRLARTWLVLSGRSRDLKAGEYRFDRPLSCLEVLDKLLRGDVLLHAVTLPEGIEIGEVARRLAEAGVGDEEELLSAFRRTAPLAEIDPRAEDLEGYLFPETYHLPKGRSAESIAHTLVERFKETTGPGYAEAAAAAGLTLREAVTLASLIEKETSRPEERGRISRVFHNRLRLGMRLQCDPTVIYALGRAGRPVARLSRADLEFDSPWNTYRATGLPPGPICSPGRASLEAAVRPAAGNELYFVAAPGGGHTFSADLASHLLAVRRWRERQRLSE